MFTPQKSKLLLFIFLAAYFIFSWFFLIAPYSEVEDNLSQVPKLFNKEFVDQLPSDLAVSVKNGQVSINQPSPYCLSLNNDPEKLGIVFDVSHSATPDPKDLAPTGRYHQFCRPVAIIGQEYILFPDKDSGYRLIKVNSDFNFTVDKAAVKNLTDQYLPRLVSLGRTAYFIGPFVIIPFVYLFMLLLNTWYALVAKFISKSLKIQTSVSLDQVFDLTLFFYTIITAVDWVIFGYFLPNVMGVDDINSHFFMRNTIIITLATLYYQSSHPPKSESQSPPDNDLNPLPQSR